MLPAQPPERRGRRAQNRERASRRGGLEAANDLPRELHRIVERPAANDAVEQRDERRVAHAAAIDDLALEKRRVVLAARELDAVVLGVERLHDGFPRALAASRAAGNLRQQLEGAFGCTEIRQAEA